MFHFVPNLKDYTWHTGRGVKRSDTYLLSVDYADGHQKLVQKIFRDKRRDLCADNGFFDVVREGSTHFRARATPLNDTYRQLKTTLKRYPHPEDIPPSHTSLARALLLDVEAWVARTVSRPVKEAALVAQHAIQPDYYIGPENPTLGIMASLGILPEELNLNRQDFVRLYQADFAHAQELLDRRFEIYVPVHPMDYNSAFDLAQYAAEQGLSKLSCGLGGLLSSRQYTDHYYRGTTCVELGQAVPHAYMRSIEVMAGLYAGYYHVTQRLPDLHILGLGTPVLLPFLARLGQQASFTAADSTSPIVDAWISPTICMYVLDPAPLKLKAHKILAHWLGGGDGWACECPYCRKMNTLYPPRLKEARALWLEKGKPTHKDILLDDDFGDLIPLLARAGDPEKRQAGSMARVGHNHWILRKLESDARTLGHEHYLTQMQAYIDYPYGGKAWKRAVEAGLDLVQATLQHTES